MRLFLTLVFIVLAFASKSALAGVPSAIPQAGTKPLLVGSSGATKTTNSATGGAKTPVAATNKPLVQTPGHRKVLGVQ
jgi:hypothetical protein